MIGSITLVTTFWGLIGYFDRVLQNGDRETSSRHGAEVEAKVIMNCGIR